MTDIVLNQLYPGGVMKQLADAAGGVVYDQYAAGGCVGQLYAAAGADVTLDQYAEGGPLHQIELEIEGGGGGDTPDWVPANAVIHIDLVGGDPQGRAWVEGTGVVAVDTLLGTDANVHPIWGTTVYDPQTLTADGYTGTSAVALIGSARTATLAGSTQTYKYFMAAGADPRMQFGMCDAIGGDYFVTAEPQQFGLSVIFRTGSGINETIENILNEDFEIDVFNKIAFTITPTRLEGAANGSAAISAPMTEDDYPTSGSGEIVAAMYLNNAGNALQSITLYDPLPSTAGLSELSEVA